MKKVVLAFLILTITSPCLAKYSGGSGDPNNPFQIANVADLLNLAADTNDYNKCFIMTADIDLDPNLPGGKVFSTAVISPDKNNSNSIFDGNAFTSVFDGAGHKILNLTIDTNGIANDYLGLFGDVNGGLVRNLGLQNINITGGDDSRYIGGLAGIIEAKFFITEGGIMIRTCYIYNCFSNGSVADGNGAFDLGGLVGRAGPGGTILYCYSEVTIIGGNNSQEFGGLAGSSSRAVIYCCYSTGAVTAGDESERLGGLVGLSGIGGNPVADCYSTGSVTGGDGSINLGGLVGYNNDGNIIGCYFLDGAGPHNGYGTPLTEDQMKQKENYIGYGWDFIDETANGPNDIWAICEGVSYPKLAWQFVAGDSDNDKYVDFEDFAWISNKWKQADSNLYCGGNDLTGDGWVDIFDIAVFADNWLAGY
jgi:hypothetical protein